LKILAISDEVVPHIYSERIRALYDDVDLVIGCGDVPFYYLEYVVSMLHAPLFYVHGNHDHEKQYMADGRVATSAEVCVCIDDEVSSLDGLTVNKGGLLLAGLGGSIRYRPGKHQYTNNQMRRRIIRLLPNLLLNHLRFGRFLDILITHAPPLGIHDKPDRAHVGFQVFNDFMQRFRPRYLLHGHSHVVRNNAATRAEYLSTEVVNVYPYCLIEF